MARSEETTVAGYLEALPDAQRADLSAVRKVIKKNLPRGIEEGMMWGMITYFIPLSRYPTTYNGQPLCFAALAAQKNYNAVYLMAAYADPAVAKWFKSEYLKSGKKLDMGQSCVRFKKLEDLPLPLIGEAIGKLSVEDVITHVEAAHPKSTAAAKKRPAKKSAAAAKKAASKKKAPTKRKSLKT